MKTKFSERSTQLEIMDDLNCQGEVVDQTLRELETINRWLGGNAVTLDGINHLLKSKKKAIETITIVDVGCGGGDILKEIADWGRRQQFDLRLTGIDANTNIISYAAKNCSSYPSIKFLSQNILQEEFQSSKYDIIVATLFTHHFSDGELIALFQSFNRQAKIGVVINDIHRHWLAYYSISLLTKVFSRSSMVQFDAPLSVLRAFKRTELESILERAGITNYKIKWKWAFRWQLIISPSLA